MIRAAVITSYFPTRQQKHRGHSAYQTLRRLTRHMEIEVFCPLLTYSRWTRPRSFDYMKVDLNYSPPDVKAHYIEYPAFPVVSRPINGPLSAAYLWPYVKKFQPDIILNYLVYPDGYAAVKIGKKLGIPVVLKAIGSDLNRIPDPATLHLTRKILRRASLVATVSNALNAKAVELGADSRRVLTIPNGCDHAIFHPRDRVAARHQLGVSQNSRLILFVGWISATKGVRELLEALVQLERSHPDVQLAYVGAGPMSPELKSSAEKHGLSNRVLLPGVYDSQGIALWMAAADVFCLPSYAEGCPNVLLEALACGRPIVATEVGGIPEMVNSGAGILVPPRDVSQLATALDRALTMQWDSVQIACLNTRTWDNVADEMYFRCVELLEENGTPPA